MKKSIYITHSLIILMSFGLLLSCKDKDVQRSAEQTQKDKLVATWQIVSAKLDNEDLTDQFVNFSLTINSDFNYVTNSTSVERQPNPWPIGGVLAFGANPDGTVNTNMLRRDGELDMAIGVNDASLSIEYNFDENLHTGSGREQAVEGDWVFQFLKN